MKSRGQKAIERQQKKLEKEKKKRIELANKMLIPTPKVTRESLNLLSFDPSGTFRMKENDWLRVYQIEIDQIEKLDETLKQVKGKLRVTTKMLPGIKKQIFFSLFEKSQTYEEARIKFVNDERALMESVKLMPLDVNQVMNQVMELGEVENQGFAYASMVRGKKNWKKECFHEVAEENEHFLYQNAFGQSFFVKLFPKKMDGSILKRMGELGCPVYLALETRELDETEEMDFNRILEEKYNVRLGIGAERLHKSCSLMISFLCDSEDARAIISNTIVNLLESEGMIISPCFGFQRTAFESSVSLGLTGTAVMLSTRRDVVKEIVEGICR